MALLIRRGGRLDAAAVSEELAHAAAEAAAGQFEKARKSYARLVKRLSSGPDTLRESLRPLLGAAVAGQGVAIDALGDAASADELYEQAFWLLEDPARDLPRSALYRVARRRMAAGHGALAAPLAFMRATGPRTATAEEARVAGEVLGWLQQACGQGSVAVREEHTAQALAGLPGWDWPVLARCAVLVEAGRSADAERLLAGAAPSGNGEVWFRWACVLYDAGRFDQAAPVFDEALGRGGGEPSPWARGRMLACESLLFRGLARLHLGQDEAARADLLAAAGLEPADPRPRDGLGRLALRQGDFAGARGHFETALRAVPSYSAARLGLAVVDEREGRATEAAAGYAEVLAAAPTWRPARIRHGAALAASGRHDQAIAILRAEAEAEPGRQDVPGAGAARAAWSRTAAFHLGVALLGAGDAQGALAAWDGLDAGTDTNADTNVSNVAAEGDGVKALAACRARARDQMARGLIDTDPAEARAQWETAIAEHPLPGYRAAAREASLREAALALVTDRDGEAGREAARAALQRASGGEAGPKASPDAVTIGREATELVSDVALLRRIAWLSSVLRLASGGATETGSMPDDGLPQSGEDSGDEACAARIQALRAEREQNWDAALEGHLRFLTLAGPETVENTRQADAHRVAGQTASQSPHHRHPAACSACGRERGAVDLYQVTGSDSPGSPRCGRCVRTGAAALVASAHRAGEDAVRRVEPVLAGWVEALGAGPVGDAVRTGLALLRAELGDLDGALALLPEADSRDNQDIHGNSEDNDSSDNVGAAVRAIVLVRRAARALSEGDASRAAADLRAALRANPGMPHAAQIAALLSRLAEHEAFGHVSERRLRKAYEAYVSLLLDDPGNPQLLHAVGVCGYRYAAALTWPADDQPRTTSEAETDEVWLWTLAALVAALHVPELWEQVAEVSGRTQAEGQSTAARAALLDRLREDLRRVDMAAGRTGDEVDAWTVRLGLELRCAEAFAAQDLRIRVADLSERRLILGPALHRLLAPPPQSQKSTEPEPDPGAEVDATSGTCPGVREQWEREFSQIVRLYALAAARPGEQGLEGQGEPLTEAFGLLHRTLGAHRFLLMQGRYEAAAAALEALPEDARDAAQQSLLTEALVNLGAEQHRGKNWTRSLGAYRRAAHIVRAGGKDGLDPDDARMAAEAALYASRALLGDRDSYDDQAGAVELLEAAFELCPGHAELRQNLAAAYTQLARKLSNEQEDFARALEFLRKALEYDPNAVLARDFLKVAVGNRANQLTKDENDARGLGQAAALWRESMRLDTADTRSRENLEYVLTLLARVSALGGDRAHALELMVEAVGIERASGTSDGASGAGSGGSAGPGSGEAEAARRLSVLLANHALDELKDKPFAARAEVLRRARGYDDSPEIRRAMANVWREQAMVCVNVGRYDDAERLLEETFKLASSSTVAGPGGSRTFVRSVREELVAVHRIRAQAAWSAGRKDEARMAIVKASLLAPGDRDVDAIRRRIEAELTP